MIFWEGASSTADTNKWSCVTSGPPKQICWCSLPHLSSICMKRKEKLTEKKELFPCVLRTYDPPPKRICLLTLFDVGRGKTPFLFSEILDHTNHSFFHYLKLLSDCLSVKRCNTDQWEQTLMWVSFFTHRQMLWLQSALPLTGEQNEYLSSSSRF